MEASGGSTRIGTRSTERYLDGQVFQNGYIGKKTIYKTNPETSITIHVGEIFEVMELEGEFVARAFFLCSTFYIDR